VSHPIFEDPRDINDRLPLSSCLDDSGLGGALGVGFGGGLRTTIP
jgi:hypothetical protein